MALMASGAAIRQIGRRPVLIAGAYFTRLRGNVLVDDLTTQFLIARFAGHQHLLYRATVGWLSRYRRPSVKTTKPLS